MRHICSIALSALIMVALLTGCHGMAACSSDDVVIRKRFYSEASLRMEDLKRDTFQASDLTLYQLRLLTPTDPDWIDAQFLVLNSEWSYQKGEKKIVIICSQARVNNGQLVNCVGYSTGETAWIPQEEIAKLQLRDFSVLPKIRP
jgi:hypothetical protein